MKTPRAPKTPVNARERKNAKETRTLYSWPGANYLALATQPFALGVLGRFRRSRRFLAGGSMLIY